jgi:hypothetical protein
MTRVILGPVVSSLLTAMMVAGCGPKESRPTTSDETAAASDSSANTASATQSDSSSRQTATSSGNPTSAPLTTDDIGRWQKGLEGEMQAVKEAAGKLKTAKSSEDTLNTMMAVQEMGTTEAGARAAGLDPERYKFVRSNLSAVVGYLTPALGGIDTSSLSQAQRDELRQGNEAQLERMRQDVPAEVVDAIRPRALELRKKDMELVGARLKGAGMTR